MGPTQFIKYLPFSPRGGGGGYFWKVAVDTISEQFDTISEQYL